VSLADSACLACITFDDGGPACHDHAGTYPGGLLRPACGSDNGPNRAARAFVCLACEL
jgi:hypothetical protein